MVGILTFHSSYNYGAYLQVYALQRFLLDENIDNIVINYKSLKKTVAEDYYTLLKRKKNPITIVRIFLKMIRFKIDLRKLKKTRRFFSVDKLGTIHFDTIILGSDQIWNYTKEWGGFDPIYFSHKLNANRIISYAASLGPEQYDKEHPSLIHESLKNIKIFGVRDTNTKKFIHLLLNKEAEMVLDPTHLYNFEKEIKAPQIKEKYILVYSDGPSPSSSIVSNVKEIAAKYKLKIISIGNKYKWCDKSIVILGPFEWLGYIKNAEFVLTSMFHGLMFSIKFSKPFAMFLSESRKNKSLDFLTRFALTDRVISQENSLALLFNTEIDYVEISKAIDQEVVFSKQFLLNALQD